MRQTKRIDLQNGCDVRVEEPQESGDPGRCLVLRYFSREVCRVPVGSMGDGALRLLAHYLSLAYLSGRRDGGQEMAQAMQRTVEEITRDLPLK